MKPTEPDLTTVVTWTGCFGAMLFTVILWAAYGLAAAIVGLLIGCCTMLWAIGLTIKTSRREGTD